MDIKEAVRDKYTLAARRAAQMAQAAPDAAASSACCHAPITGGLYSVAEKEAVPAAAATASLGCGNPTALAQLRSGEIVLDLGSGGGIDVFLAARRVGPTGKVYGLDMTDEMLELARANQRQAGLSQVEFLRGEIENIPLADSSVDVVISNCVINLSGDKDRVFSEAFRVLRPGGRLAVADIVTHGEVPVAARRGVLAWAGCLAGALDVNDYYARLAAAGFTDIDIEAIRVYRAGDILRYLADKGWDISELAAMIEGRFISAFIRAVKTGHSATVR